MSAYKEKEGQENNLCVLAMREQSPCPTTQHLTCSGGERKHSALSCSPTAFKPQACYQGLYLFWHPKNRLFAASPGGASSCSSPRSIPVAAGAASSLCHIAGLLGLNQPLDLLQYTGSALDGLKCEATF